MGFLDGLIKRSVKNAVRNEVDHAVTGAVTGAVNKAVHNAFNGLNNTGSANAYPAQNPGAQQANWGAPPPPPANDAAWNDAPAAQTNFWDTYTRARLLNPHNEQITVDWSAQPSPVLDRGSAAYFTDLVARNFPGLTADLEVDLATFLPNAPQYRVPVTVLLRRGGVPVLAILLVRKGAYRSNRITYTLNCCEQNGIPAIRFMKEFRNDPGYVVARIRTVMRG